MSGKLILVTGVTGFIAGHVANKFVEAGYRVRGTARGAKAKALTAAVNHPSYEFVQVDDLIKDDLTEALKGVYGVAHVASPLPGKTSDVDDALDSAIEATLNVMRQTEKAGIEKMVLTGTFGSVCDPTLIPAFGGLTFTESDWGEVTREQALAKKDDAYYVYFASKIIAERAMWKFAEEHPKLDIACVLPGFVYGPFAEHIPTPTKAQLGTNSYILGLIKGGTPPQPPPCVVDARDVGRGHVLAFELPRKPVGEKRYFLNGGLLSWQEATKVIAKSHPDIKTTPQPDLPGPPSGLDMSKTQRDLKFGEFISPETTIIETVNALLAAEKTWN
ncbi:hypothetical protein BDZ94DRAFT_1217542 [Collybia nuda]|uniref:NAD-dependent epimerase/dehydratase domain-containing protein n=1 Tax=Collybia nuda TaxID=64659 RepID=A0A9P6CKG2_9AGAR|nr:hypothetical protein BDZ94DRAFT_1217542 [Collybia nuda]